MIKADFPTLNVLFWSSLSVCLPSCPTLCLHSQEEELLEAVNGWTSYNKHIG